MTVSIVELKAKASEIVARAEGGELITITRNGDEVAQLGPVRSEIGRIEQYRQFREKIAKLPRPDPPITKEEILEWIHEGRKY